MPLEKISLMCFEASYAVALALELLQLAQRRLVLRWLSLLFGAAGLLAQSLYLALNSPPLTSQVGSMLYLTWTLAIFYFYGALHHRRQTWGLFVLPLVIGIGGLAWAFQMGSVSPPNAPWFDPRKFWSILHGVLLLLASVGISVGFIASVMYLFQAHRLRSKASPGHGLRLPSLEKLEQMNRRAIVWAFPLLTAGVIVATIQMTRADEPVVWTHWKSLTAGLLWLSFLGLLFLRYGVHLRGRQTALLTIATFILMLLFLAVSHSGLQGGEP
jgi:ABC-type transport system involved in cytochrome c biogenesis permease subunit